MGQYPALRSWTVTSRESPTSRGSASHRRTAARSSIQRRDNQRDNT